MAKEVELNAHVFDNINTAKIKKVYHQKHSLPILTWFDHYSAVAFQIFSNGWVI